MKAVTLELKDETLKRLQDEAQRLNMPLDAIINVAIEHYLDDEPTHDEILTGLRQAMKDVLNGHYRPVDEVLAELKEEFDFNADES